jgi:Txe/YoeB family toxin of Txe-Axe toxin-antitoxin module
MPKKTSVVFASEKLEKSFENLGSEESMRKYLMRAIDDLKQDPFCGTKLPQRLFPKEYVQRYNIDNLWKYDLPDGWRLIYTLVNKGQVEIISVILEWFDHKDYERRFSY